jgi:hypothetical protein
MNEESRRNEETRMEARMRQTHPYRSALAATALLLGGLLAWPTASRAQTVIGQGTAVQATVFGATTLLGTTPTTTTTLADSGVIGATNVEQDVGEDPGSVASLLNADVLSSGTYSYVDEVDSQSSLGDLNLTVAGASITADSAMAEASQVLGYAGSGTSYVDNLAVNGVPIAVTGYPNQTVAIPGGQVVINEQTISPTGTAVVNALHVTVTGVADVVIASATAGIS